jgi:Family of unknown function (DUF5677)
MILSRSLYEHTVTLAWLTGDAENARERLELFQRDDYEQRRKADVELTKIRGKPLLTDDNKAVVDQVRGLPGSRKAPPFTDRAKIGDEEWGERFGFTSSENPLASLRSAYSTLYRFASSFAHPTLLGLNFVAERTESATVVFVEKGDQGTKALSLVPSLLGFVFVISSDLLGIPRIEDVNRVFEVMKGGQS